MKPVLKKLPKNAYRLEWKDFKQLIKDLEPEQQERYARIYNRVASLHEGKRKDKGSPYYSSGSKLTDYQREYVLSMASKFFTPLQILKVITEEWKIKYSNSALNNFLKRHADEIMHARTFIS